MKRPLPKRPTSSVRCAVTYRRVSTDDQVDGTSLDDQRAVTRRKAEELGYRVVAECVDEGVSGAYYETRPGIQEALSLLESGEAQALVVSTLDRLGRSRLIQELCADRARRAEGKIIYCDFDLDDDSPASLLHLGIQGEFAAYERLVFRKRAMKGQRNRANEGKIPNGRAPYGYHAINKNDVIRGLHPAEMRGRPIIVEEQAKIVRRVFAEIGEGNSLFDVTRRLNLEGIPSAQGAQWQRCVIQQMLRNTAYIGEMRWGKRQRRTDESRLDRGYARRDYQVPAPESKQVVIPCDPLVTREVWEKAQKVLERNKEVRRGRPDRKYMLSGLLRCSKCGRAMRVATGVIKKQKPSGEWKHYDAYYYCCRSYRSAGMVSGEECLKKRWGGPKLEAAILGKLLEALSNPDLIRVSLEQKTPEVDKEVVAARLAEIEREQTALSKRERATVTAQLRALENDLDPALYDSELVKVTERRRVLAEELASLQRKRQEEVQQQGQAEAIAEALSKIEHQLTAPEVSPLDKREALLTVLDSAVPFPDGTLRLVFRF